MTRNYVVILGMGLELRCIHRLSPQSMQLFSYLNFSSLKLLALTALPKLYMFFIIYYFFYFFILVMGPKLYVEWA